MRLELINAEHASTFIFYPLDTVFAVERSVAQLDLLAGARP